MKKLNATERLNLMGEFVGNTNIEGAYYAILNEKMADYDGGFFEIVEVDGVPALFIEDSEKVSVDTAFSSIETDIKTATLALWILNVNWASWAFHDKDIELSKKYADAYQKLIAKAYEDENPFDINQSDLFKILD